VTYLDDLALILACIALVIEVAIFAWMHKAVWDIEHQGHRLYLSRVMMRIVAMLVVLQVLMTVALYMLAFERDQTVSLRIALYIVYQATILFVIVTTAVSIWRHRRRT
jgi:hypothetical protein